MDIDKEHVMKIIDNMKSKTSCGFDGISMKIVKSIKKNILAEPLTIIINQMRHTGIFPDLLKLLRLLPYLKKMMKQFFQITDQFHYF